MYQNKGADQQQRAADLRLGLRYYKSEFSYLEWYQSTL